MKRFDQSSLHSLIKHPAKNISQLELESRPSTVTGSWEEYSVKELASQLFMLIALVRFLDEIYC